MINTKIFDYILCSQRWRSSIQSKKQDWELTVALIMNSLLPNSDKLKKVGKTTRPFRYEPNHVPCDYTVEMTNRCKGLDLIDRLSEELWTEVPDTVQEGVIKTIPKKKKCTKAKWLRSYKWLCKKEKLKAKETRKDISI